jgi:large subunit ribosomal protein L24
MSKTSAPAKRPKLRIRSGDRVQVISGKDRGKRGKVLRTEPKNERVFVEGLNMVKRHTKHSEVAGAQSEQWLGGVIEREGPIHISNVMLLDPSNDKPTRVGIERVGSERYRVAKRSGTRLDEKAGR